MGRQLIFDGREGGRGEGGRRCVSSESLISLKVGWAWLMGLEGAVADTAELELPVLYHYPLLVLYPAPVHYYQLLLYSHYTLDTLDTGHWRCERWPTLSCAECRAAKGKYLVPRVRGREYSRNTNEHKSKYDRATTHKGFEYLCALWNGHKNHSYHNAQG